MSTFANLKALFVNCTLKLSPELSHTQGLIDLSSKVMESQGVQVETLRLVDHTVPAGVYPDMTEYGHKKDDWMKLWPKFLDADILVVAGPIWLGENSSVMRILIERLYAMSAEINDKGQYLILRQSGGHLGLGQRRRA